MSAEATAEKKIDSAAIYALLRARHSLPSWCFLPEVRDATGWAQRRTADALALDCYPSRGLEVHGFEIKVSRGDWLRELKDSSKSASIAGFCDRWWIVAPQGVVKQPELPKAWGLMTAGDILRVAVQAPLIPKEPMDASFIASLVRTALQSNTEAIKASHTEGWNDGFQRGKESAQAVPRDARTKTARLLEGARAFQRASGIDFLAGWGAEHAARLGKATRVGQAILDGRHGQLSPIREAANIAAHHAKNLAEKADELDRLFSKEAPPC